MSLLEPGLLAALTARTPSPEPVGPAVSGQVVDDSNIDPRLRGPKRVRVEGDDDEPAYVVAQDENLVILGRRLAVQNRFTPEHSKELVEFAAVSTGYKLVLMATKLLQLQESLDKIHAAAPPFKASEALKTDMMDYSWVVVTCSQLDAYTGDKVPKHIIALVRRLTTDLPVGIENSPAAWAEVLREASYAATQVRAAIKKHIKESINASDPSQSLDAIALTNNVASHAKISPTLPFATRLALMRRVYERTPGNGFWPAVDAQLTALRQEANNDPVRLIRGFKFILTIDLERHGKLNQDHLSLLPDKHVVDERQQYAEDAVLDTPAIEASIQANWAAQAAAASQTAALGATPQGTAIAGAIEGPSAAMGSD